MNLLLKITKLVDKDVAQNSKPLSIVGAAIPFIPFMIFVEGAPVDSHPVLAGAALAASFAWLGLVMWRVVLHTMDELAPYQRSLGRTRFWALIAGTVMAILLLAAVLMWLER